jgi:hypothetical protein
MIAMGSNSCYLKAKGLIGPGFMSYDDISQAVKLELAKKDFIVGSTGEVISFVIFEPWVLEIIQREELLRARL